MRASIVLSTLAALFGCDGPGAPADASAARDAASIDAGDRADASGIDAAGADGDAPGDGAAPDAGGGVGCAGRDYLLCEDFESAVPGSLPAGWEVGFGWQSEDTRPEVSDVSAHTGSRALRSSIAISGQRRAERSIEALAGARGVHWGRVFYRVETPAFVPSSGVVHNTLVALLGADEARVVDTVQRNDGMHQFLYNVPDDSCCAGSAYDYDTYDGAWHCAEWRVDRTDQSFQFFVDGTEVTSIAFEHGAGSTRAHMDEFDRIALGWRNYQTPDVPYTSYLDDLAIDDARIGCD